ncbi:hypothetical protein GDO81_007255 [Engystomops pustulosus]|uniref:Uncharacterized protein n=1 Tax=Engystomops pustulosus TaxID=76066 RepID=A0AAV7C6Q0_ENGPU|nr:hypothetical protein GDO81_007255 [Engystomops pustulosus]
MEASLNHYLAEKRKIKRGKVIKDKAEKKEVTKIFQRKEETMQGDFSRAVTDCVTYMMERMSAIHSWKTLG